MKSLQSLVDEYGEPSALIDHHDSTSVGIAVWGWTDIIELSPDQLAVSGETIRGDIFTNFQQTLDKWKSESEGISAVGFFSYDAKDLFFPHINFKASVGWIPKIWFGKPDQIEKYDPKEVHGSKPNYIRELKTAGEPIEKGKYFKDLSSIKENLEKGNVYQINYTYPMKFEVETNPYSLYRRLREISSPANGMYLNTDKFSVLSLSPERFIRKKNNEIETFPIKGTRKRSENKLHDELLANQLSCSEKDRAEHLMIVDLMRNDLGKICQYGSVKVEDLFKIHSFPTVHHMISRVYGELRQNTTEMDIFRATFPGGSITGAPKESAMKIIDELEEYSRGIYTGSLGYITSGGDMDFNIAIRTMTVRNGKGIYPVGGGIVWDSDPEKEWDEAIQKSKILSMNQE